MTSETTIATCKIGPYPKSFFDPMPKVAVTYNDGKEETLFTFYPDELSFDEREFIGLTRVQAMSLRHRKDVAYLPS
jgi:hypothetical protein